MHARARILFVCVSDYRCIQTKIAVVCKYILFRSSSPPGLSSPCPRRRRCLVYRRGFFYRLTADDPLPASESQADTMDRPGRLLRSAINLLLGRAVEVDFSRRRRRCQLRLIFFAAASDDTLRSRYGNRSGVKLHPCCRREVPGEACTVGLVFAGPGSYGSVDFVWKLVDNYIIYTNAYRLYSVHMNRFVTILIF